MRIAVLLLFLAALAQAQPSGTPALHGVVTDPSGALVPGALVQLRGPGGEQRATTDATGRYNFAALREGKYLVRVIARGFTVSQRKDFEITGPTALDVQLIIQPETQVVNVEDEAAKVSADPDANGSAIVLKEKELEALSDDPDELMQQLQAMAGPGGGPNGGQIYIDGFTGNNLPSKSSIREVRINTNPMSPEFDRPGFGRIEIFTRPGTDFIRGQAYVQYNKEALNARSPLVAQSKRPPYKVDYFGINITGPLKKQKASFGLDVERRATTENAYVIATVLDSGLNPVSFNQAILQPQSRLTVSPRIDYSINAKNTLSTRFQHTGSELDHEGVGGFVLSSQAYNSNNSENTVQATETMAISTKAVNETRFQYMRLNVGMTGDNSVPALSVPGAFSSGGPQIGNSGAITSSWELTNITTFTVRTHTIKWGARLRQSFLDDTSVRNFGGTFTFFGGAGPELDASNQPIPNSLVQLTALERYRRTLLFQKLGLSAALIRQYGGGASQFSINAGVPIASVSQFDIGMFANDDWRIRPNLTLSFGLRYENQTNISDDGDIAPRVAVAWGIDGHGNKAARTVLRAGFGTFYDRVPAAITLGALRFNGTTQQSYLLQCAPGTNAGCPDFFPTSPPPGSLQGGLQRQQLQSVFGGMLAGRSYQANFGVDRQINQYARVSVNYVTNRGVHLLRSRNINAPLNGVYPYGDQAIRLLTEDDGFSRSNMLMVMPNVNYKKLFLFGFYVVSYGKDDNEGQPANPYNLRAEWGPSSFADVRQRFVTGTGLPLPFKFTISPFIMVNTGSPYNITTGVDTLGTGFTTQRPALVAGAGAAACHGTGLVYAPAFGCFSLNPAPGTASIGRNYGRGPGQVTLSLRLSRTWAFGNKGESGMASGSGMPPGMGGVRDGGGPPGGGRMGGGPPGGGPPPGMFGSSSGKKYNLTFSASARNALNHPNFSAPNGDLSSPYFGQSLGLAGFGPPGLFPTQATYNRRIDLQLRLQF